MPHEKDWPRYFFLIEMQRLERKMTDNDMKFLGDLPPIDRVTSGSGGIARGGRGKSLEATSAEMEVGGSGWCRGGKN